MIFRILDETIEILRDLVSLVRRENDNSIKSSTLREIADNFADLGLLEEAKELLIDAYKCALDIEEVDKMMSEVLEISRSFYSLGFIDHSIKVLEETVDRARELVGTDEKLFVLIQVAEELIDIKFLDLAREVIEQVMSIYFDMDLSDVDDIELLIRGFKLISFFEKGDVLRKVYQVILARLEEEDEDDIDELYLEILDTLIDLKWFPEIRDIILNRIRTIEDKLDATSKLVEKISDAIRGSIKTEFD